MADVPEPRNRGDRGVNWLLVVAVLVLLLLVAWFFFAGPNQNAPELEVPEADAPEIQVPEEIDINVRGGDGG